MCCLWTFGMTCISSLGIIYWCMFCASVKSRETVCLCRMIINELGLGRTCNRIMILIGNWVNNVIAFLFVSLKAIPGINISSGMGCTICQSMLSDFWHRSLFLSPSFANCIGLFWLCSCLFKCGQIKCKRLWILRNKEMLLFEPRTSQPPLIATLKWVICWDLYKSLA